MYVIDQLLIMLNI